jgi:hypothetical protein
MAFGTSRLLRMSILTTCAAFEKAAAVSSPLPISQSKIRLLSDSGWICGAPASIAFDASVTDGSSL